MNYVERIKLRPDKVLEQRLDILCDISRFTYNWVLAQSIEYFNKTKKKPSKKDILSQRKQFRLLVKNSLICDKNGEIYPREFQDILKSTPSQIIDMVCDDVDRAWKTLKKNKVPSFKCKRDSRQSFTLHKKTNTTFKFTDNILKVAKMEFKLKKIRFIKEASQIKRVSIVKSTYGWYINILIDIPESTFLMEKTGKSVGIDWGVSKFATDSDGNYVSFREIEGHNNYTKLEKHLKELQRILSKKRMSNSNWRTSNRYKKLKHKISYVYEKLANIRRNFIHLVSKLYLSEYDTIAIENLKPSNMLKNHKLAKSISMAMFYTWKITLQYKAAFFGKEVILVDPRNTSQTCSNCGEKSKEKLKLSEKIFKCKACNHEIDRDYNAAINILKRA